MNTVEKVFCPSCGAPVVFEENSEEVFCSHCGSRLHRDDDNVVRKMEHAEIMAEYQDRHEEREYDAIKAREEMKNLLIGIPVMIIGTVLIIGLLILCLHFLPLWI